jgi:hypothetical protein
VSTVSITGAVETPSRVGGRPLAAIASGAAVVVAVALAVVASGHASPSEVSPVVPLGAWNDVWVAGVAAAFMFYGLGVYLVWSTHVRLRVVLGIAVAVQALPLAAPLLLSKDVYAYWGEARVLSVHHANPYVATPADYPRDAALPWISESWRAEPADYGPAWELVAAAPASAAGASAHSAQLAYRVLAFLALLACILIVGVRTRSPAAVAFLGWSPLVALHFGGGGHGDAVMMAFVLAAIASGATARAGALWPVAAAFKPLAPILVPLELAQRRLAIGRRWWLGLVVSTLGVAAVSTALFGSHWLRSGTAGAHQTSPLGGVHWLVRVGLTHHNAVLAGAVVFLLAYAALLRDAWLHRRARFSLAASALCLTSSLLRPWYVLWPVALAALEEDAPAAVVAYVLSGYLLFGDAVRL